MKLDEVSDKQLSDSYNTLVAAKEEALLAELDRKEYEKTLKEELAMKKQLYKKDGTTLDLAKVKVPTFKKAMEVHLNGGPNKVEEELELLEEYILDMKNDSTVMARAKSFQNKMIQESESKGAAKDSKEEMKTYLDSEIVEAMDIVASFEIQAKKERLEAENGQETKKKKSKNQEEILSLVQQLKQKLGLV